jgi:hypothetical protein
MWTSGSRDLGLRMVETMRLIDADELIHFYFDDEDGNKTFGFVPDEFIDEAPTIEAEPKHGSWWKDDIKLGDDYSTVLVCSECDKINWGMVKWNYCPNCGAKMDE